VPAGSIDPVYFNGKSYYLLPDALIGQRPFQVICQGMAEEGVWAVAQVVLHGREQLILLRPVDNMLAMIGLSYDAKVNKVASFEGEAPPMQLSEEQRELTGELIRASMQKRLDLAKYHDVYTEKLTALVEAKVQGKEVVAAPAGVEPKVINLMDALKKSVAEAQKASEQTAKPPKKMAASARGTAARKKKTS
jgi:DNA end-binding protein Ku